MFVSVSHISDSCDRCLQNESVIVLHNQTVTRPPLTLPRGALNQAHSSQFPHHTRFISKTSTVGALALTAGTIPGNRRTGGHRRSRSYKSHVMVTRTTSTAPAWCFIDLLWRTEQTAPSGGFLFFYFFFKSACSASRFEK